MTIAENVRQIRGKIGSAELVAITKNRSVEEVREVLAAGVVKVGENQVQEAEEKIAEVEADWQFVGHLQSNKVAKACELFSCIQSVDSLKLAEKLSENDAPGVMVQVFTGGGEYGFKPEDVFTAVRKCRQFGLNVVGLMTIASIENPEESFVTMAELFKSTNLKFLSMGMTDDYELALKHGSNMVRLGRCVFGGA